MDSNKYIPAYRKSINILVDIPLNWILWPYLLEFLLANRRAKTAPIHHTINNNLSHNSLNPQVNTNTDIKKNPSNVTDNTSLSVQPLSPLKNVPDVKLNQLTFNQIIPLSLISLILLYLPISYLFFHMDLHSAPHHDILIGCK